MTGSDAVGTRSVGAHALALAALPGMGPARLRALLDAYGAVGAWRHVCTGTVRVEQLRVHGGVPQAVLRDWRSTAITLDPTDRWQQHRAAGVAVLVHGSAGYPSALLHDPDPPLVLCAQGDPAPLDLPRVAIVGTRRATRYGHDVARRLGAELSEAGVSVVSGLALGIDGAAHAGALGVASGAPPIGVVGSGLDVVYPARNRGLWEQVVARGLLCSEWPLGTRPEPWRFPARNRIIAGLADAVVVVESPERGGSMHTVDEALARDRPVLAVPGPITARSSMGTNRLLADGATPLLDVEDVLRAVGTEPPPRTGTTAPAPPSGTAGAVLDALGWQPTGLDELAARLDLSTAQLAVELTRLELEGWIARQGLWIERVCR